MNNAAVICKLENVRPHPNADKVQLATACGYQVVVGLEYKDGDLGIYFPTDTCLGKDYAEYNPDLLTYFGKNLRVRTQTFRGEKSEGFWAHIGTLPISVFELSTKVGTEFTTVSNVEICKKYINPATLSGRIRDLGAISKKLRSGSLPTFQKHVDTSHLRKEWNNIPRDREWIWTEKVHGTSQRVGNVLVAKDLSIWEKIKLRLGFKVDKYKYDYLVGTRNVILGELRSDGSVGKDGFYSDEFRKQAALPFLGKLVKGEVVYYEVVGYQAYNSPIMGEIAVKDSSIKKIYGNKVVYSYGCKNGDFDIYVYRIAYQNQDGNSIDLPWHEVKSRCMELGVKSVPEIDHRLQQTWTIAEDALDRIGRYIDIPSPIDSSHPMEGVVLRVEGDKPEFYKEKSFIFKVLEGIIKDSNQVDIEEAS
jgi:hypothetical protein